MRREKFEFSVSPPTVVYKMDGGRRLEPIEEVHMEIEDEHSGPVIEALTVRRGELVEMTPLSVSPPHPPSPPTDPSSIEEEAALSAE